MIGFLANPSNPNTTRDTEEAQAAAEQLGHKLVTVKASTVAEIDTAFATLVQANVGGLVVDAECFLCRATRSNHDFSSSSRNSCNSSK